MTRNRKAAKAQKAQAPLMSEVVPRAASTKSYAQAINASTERPGTEPFVADVQVKFNKTLKPLVESPDAKRTEVKEPDIHDRRVPEARTVETHKSQPTKLWSDHFKAPKTAADSRDALIHEPLPYRIKVLEAPVKNTKVKETHVKKPEAQSPEVAKADLTSFGKGETNAALPNKIKGHDSREASNQSINVRKPKKKSGKKKNSSKKVKGAGFTLTLEALDYTPPSKTSSKSVVENLTVSASTLSTSSTNASKDCHENHTQVDSWRKLDEYVAGSVSTENNQQQDFKKFNSSAATKPVQASASNENAEILSTELPDFLKHVSPFKDLKKICATPFGNIGLLPPELETMVLSNLDYGAALNLQMTSTYYRDHRDVKPQETSQNSKFAFLRFAEKFPIHCGLMAANGKQHGFGCFGCFKIKTTAEFEQCEITKQSAKGGKLHQKRLCLLCDMEKYPSPPSKEIYDGEGQQKFFCPPCNNFKGGLHCPQCKMCSGCLQLPERWSEPWCPRCKSWTATAKLRGYTIWCRNNGLVEHRLTKEHQLPEKKRGIPSPPRALTKGEIEASW